MRLNVQANNNYSSVISRRLLWK